MPDIARNATPEPDIVDARHTLSVREVEAMLANAGVARSHRHVLRLCQSGLFDAVKIPGPSGDEWFISPSSVPKAIGDLQQIETHKARRGAPHPAMSPVDVGGESTAIKDGTASHDVAEPAMSLFAEVQPNAKSEAELARHGPPRDDIYEHPYVRRLEDRCEKLEAKLDAQVRRTEEIQIRSQEKLLELQRMTAVGQSQTLAEFMLKAKDLILGRGAEADKDQASAPELA